MTDSERLKKIREGMQLTQEEFAKVLTVKLADIDAYERGDKRVPTPILDRAYLINYSRLEARFDADGGR